MLSAQCELDELLKESPVSAAKRERSAFDRLAWPFAERLVLFGAGALGRKTAAGLRLSGIEPLAFADNNPACWGKTIDGLEVCSPEEAASRFSARAAFVVTIWHAGGGHRFSHTRDQLLHLGCEPVIPFAALFWKYAEVFLPYYAIGLPHLMLKQAEQIREAFELWNDDASRREYLAQVRWRLRLDFDVLPPPVGHAQYFPDDLWEAGPQEVFVDCGAYDGDTLRILFARQESFRGQVVAIEPDAENARKLHEYVASLPEPLRGRVAVLPVAVGASAGRTRFCGTGTAAARVHPEGTAEVQCAPLDELLHGILPSFIKMDIEGAELDALAGARHLLHQARPVLAVCVYHQPDHLWRIPLFIRGVVEDYCYFLRPHNEEGWDLVCYAIPRQRLRR